MADTDGVPATIPEYEVQELLKFKISYGRPYVLVRWKGLRLRVGAADTSS